MGQVPCGASYLELPAKNKEQNMRTSVENQNIYSLLGSFVLSHIHISRYMIVLIPNKYTNLTHLLGKRVTIYWCVIIPSNHSKARNRISPHQASKRKEDGD